MTEIHAPRTRRTGQWLRRLAPACAVCLAVSCAGDRTAESDATVPVMIDCAEADPAGVSFFAVDAFQRDLAIDTPKRITEHLDAEPALICRTLESGRYGTLTPIAYAAGHRPDAQMIFPLLVERGADPADALPVAVWRGDSRVVPWLLEHGVDPNTGSALVLAAQRGDTRMVQRLLQAGADPSRPVTENPWIENDGRTALHHAAVHNLPEMLRALLDAGADVNAVDREGRTPLAEAAVRRQAGTVRLLFDRGAAPTRMRTEDVERLRRVATTYGMTDIVDFLD